MSTTFINFHLFLEHLFGLLSTGFYYLELVFQHVSWRDLFRWIDCPQDWGVSPSGLETEIQMVVRGTIYTPTPYTLSKSSGHVICQIRVSSSIVWRRIYEDFQFILNDDAWKSKFYIIKYMDNFNNVMCLV